MERLYINQVRLEPIDECSYVSNLPVVRWLLKTGKLEFTSNVTFFIGENGTGKSTIIEAIAICAGFNAEGGLRNFNFSTRQTCSDLYKYMTISRAAHEKDGFFLRAESFYNVATQVDELRLNLDGYGGLSLHEQSHGESFMSLVQHRFRGNGLYILDEPEAALSPLRQMQLLSEMKRLVDKKSQFIIATHSPIILAYPGAVIYQITEEGVQQVEYQECDNYIITKQFLEAPERMIHYLFDS
ncbi:MAG: AAA family ATPase [Clostridiales bacterium]|nr:AAA family ATPase [Clostridiales bacterium]